MINRSILMPEFICGLFVVLFFTLQLFIFGPAGYRNITIVKYVSFLIICGCFFLAVILCSCLGRRGVLRTKKEYNFTEIFVVLFMILTILSAVLSEFFPETIIGAHRKEGALSICIYGLIFLVVKRNLTSERFIIYLIGAVTAVFAAVCILQFFKINALWLFPEGLNYYDGGIKYSGEFLGTLGNAGLTSAFLCLVIPILLIYISRAKEKSRLWLLIPVALGTIVLLKSRIAAGVLGLFLGLFLVLPYIVNNKRSRKIIFITEILFVIAALIFVYVNDFQYTTMHEFHEVLHGNFEDSYGSSRIFIWRHTLPLLADRPIFGGGADTLADRIGVIFETVKEDGTIRKASIDAAHNEYLNIAVCQGIPALIVYLAALLSTFVRFIRCDNKSPAAAAFGAGIMCYSIQAFFGISIFICAPYFWIIWALLESSLQNKK